MNASTSKPAVFLDRDGVINRDTDYPHLEKDLEILPGVPEALKSLADAGYYLIVITNQSGIGRGYFTAEHLKCFHELIQKKISASGVQIDAFYYCPHHPDDNCHCRKPKTQLIKDAQRKFSIDMERSYFIGDKQSDIDCGIAAGVKTIQVGEREKVDQAHFHAKDLTSSLPHLIPS